MKLKILLISLVTIIIACSSSTENECPDEARVLGGDYRECMCCGGWFIEIQSDTFRFQTLPEGSDIELDQNKMPIDVYVEWEKVEEPCLGDEIKLLKISLR